MNLFDEIDAVSWAKLHHAYGSASDVPDLLKALMAPEAASPALRDAAAKNKRSVFEHVTWTLWGNVFHQGSVWQVTATTIPFLAVILRDGPQRPESKEFLIRYLHHLALGYPEDIFPNFQNPEQAFAAVAGMRDPGGEPDYGADDNRPLIWMRDSYEAVERHIDFISPYLDAPHDKVANAAIAFCASFPRCANRTIPFLRNVARSGGRRGATAAISLAVLSGSEALPLTLSIAASTDRLTAVLGACAVVLSGADNISDDIIASLTMPLEALAKERSAHASTISNLVGRCLARLGPGYRERAVEGICRQLASASWLESLSLTQSLLKLVFEKQPPKHASALSDVQRAALEAIRDHGAFKVRNGIFANYSNLLAGWGLPQSADAIDTWLRNG